MDAQRHLNPLRPANVCPKGVETEDIMGKVFSHMTMSLDGFIAGPDDQVEDLFE